MLPVISLLILAFAVSLDGFGVGVMYGLRKIRIPLVSIGIISLWSGHSNIADTVHCGRR
jgi:putative Mn2+ efflux pump MntP